MNSMMRDGASFEHEIDLLEHQLTTPSRQTRGSASLDHGCSYEVCGSYAGKCIYNITG